MKNIAWNSPSKMNLFPLVKARFSGKWFVLCFEIQRELCRNSTLICSAIKYNHWTYRYFVFTVREVCLCWPVVKTRAKKEITISKKNTLKESLQEDCCGNRFCVKECHSCTLRERKTSVSFRSFRLIGGTKTLKSIEFVYWL